MPSLAHPKSQDRSRAEGLGSGEVPTGSEKKKLKRQDKMLRGEPLRQPPRPWKKRRRSSRARGLREDLKWTLFEGSSKESLPPG